VPKIHIHGGRPQLPWQFAVFSTAWIASFPRLRRGCSGVDAIEKPRTIPDLNHLEQHARMNGLAAAARSQIT